MGIFEAERHHDKQYVQYLMGPSNWWAYCAAYNTVYRMNVNEWLPEHYSNAVDKGIVFC